jgi:hypothetical protein
VSRESAQLKALADEQWRLLGAHVQKLPGRTGDVLSAFAGKHPLWTTAGAAALTVWFMSRRRKRLGKEPGGSRLPAALAAIGAQMLPELLKALHLTVPTSGAFAPRKRPEPDAAGYRPE